MIQKIDALEQVAELLSNIDLDDKNTYLKTAFDRAFDLIPKAQKGTFFELKGNHLIPLFTRGYDLDLIRKLNLSINGKNPGYKGISEPVIRARTSHIRNRSTTEYTPVALEILGELGTLKDYHSLYTPLVSDGKVIGIFCLENFDQGFDDYSHRILTVLARILSNFYEKILNQQEISERYYSAVSALVSAIEVKDFYTRGHGDRVRAVSMTIARRMGLPLSEVEEIGIAALLHDVGKIGIPKEILNKPEELTDNERALIREHPELSRKIISSIIGFENVCELVYTHHERYDGSGYPRGLKGHEMPIGSAIIQLADVYDALTSNRAYREPATRREALEYLAENRGGLFHPDVVDKTDFL